MAGYNIQCDPGSLYSRKCFTVGAGGVRQEIIGYDNAGNPISKQATTAAGTAWQPALTVLDQDGNPYQPYGSGGIPWTLGGGMTGIGNVMPSGGADPQDWKYITENAPGAQARIAYENRICNPLWPTFGCKTGETNPTGVTTGPTGQPNAGTLDWLKEYFGFWNAEQDYEKKTADNKIMSWWHNLLGS
jgi:hypothetical protein|tara:strand:+ start:585 stop:1148 length:564 start_codon:yes stop_codon:yes gene_type:complete